jgi:hypothetical protein
MRKILYLSIWMLALSLVFFWISISNIAEAQFEDRKFGDNPVKVLEVVKKNANKSRSDQVQKTKLDNTTSKWCRDIGLDSRFTFTRTLCYIKNNVWSYLQYIMYAWLTAATILLIWNWFKLVTSQDREKEMKAFSKNLIWIAVWITLLLWFYYFIDIYVWIINLFSD